MMLYVGQAPGWEKPAKRTGRGSLVLGTAGPKLDKEEPNLCGNYG